MLLTWPRSRFLHRWARRSTMTRITLTIIFLIPLTETLSGWFAPLLSRYVTVIIFISHILMLFQERSSSQRKEMFLNIQATQALEKPPEDRKKPKALILDMPIRWSSSFMMLLRGYSLRIVSALVHGCPYTLLILELYHRLLINLCMSFAMRRRMMPSGSNWNHFVLHQAIGLL